MSVLVQRLCMAFHSQTPLTGSHTAPLLSASASAPSLVSHHCPPAVHAWGHSPEHHEPSPPPGLRCAAPCARNPLPTSSTCLLLLFEVQDSFLLEALPDHLPRPRLFPRWGCEFPLHPLLALGVISALSKLVLTSPHGPGGLRGEGPCLLFSESFHQHFVQCLAHSRHLTSTYTPSTLC